MYYYDEKLKELQQQTARKKKSEAILKELHFQQSDLKEKVKELENIKLREQIDVDKLEGRSLANFFYSVIGKMDEKLDKERQEAYAAAVKYDVAAKELEAVEADIQRIKCELCDLQFCEQQYENLLLEKKEAVKASGNKAAGEIFQLEEDILHNKSQQKELKEAIAAGKMAYSAAGKAMSKLKEAEGWGVWDLAGGGLLADVIKHGKLDEAQADIEELQMRLRRFKTELADVTFHADMQVTIEGFLKFADFFFDGLFVDWEILDQIKQSKKQLMRTESQIETMIQRLESMATEAETQQEALKKRLEEQILLAE